MDIWASRFGDRSYSHFGCSIAQFRRQFDFLDLTLNRWEILQDAFGFLVKTIALTSRALRHHYESLLRIAQ